MITEHKEAGEQIEGSKTIKDITIHLYNILYKTRVSNQTSNAIQMQRSLAISDSPSFITTRDH
jgi:hypothetical protein